MVNWEQLESAGYEVDSIFMTISSIACSLDPCPSRSVKAAQGVLSEWVLVVVNSSFTERVVSLLIKESLVHPLLKKPSLDPTMLDNFHLVTNLSGKVLEKTYKGPWMKWIILILSSQDSDLDMGWKFITFG